MYFCKEAGRLDYRVDYLGVEEVFSAVPFPTLLKNSHAGDLPAGPPLTAADLHIPRFKDALTRQLAMPSKYAVI